MELGCLKACDTEIKYSFLKDGKGKWIQFFYTIRPEKIEQIAHQMHTIESAEAELFKTLNLARDTVVVKRFFSSDLINHYDVFLDHKKRQSTDFFLSLIEQPPVSRVKALLLGMCLNNILPDSKNRTNNVFTVDTTPGIKHIFIENLLDPEADQDRNAEEQTRIIFKLLENILAGFDTTIKDSVLRTWIYAPNVDADYPEIVKARKEIFNAINLTKDTHYIASTGIQGKSSKQFARVFMDVWSLKGIDGKNVRYIQVPEYMCPTDNYGVTFERATAVRMGRIDHLFISGTASIDKHGDILYPGDVEKQTRRALENISAVLIEGGFSKNDLSNFMVYLRDPSDYEIVKSVIDQYCENLPAIYADAPVCRPGWLVEIEGTAAKVIE